MEKLIIYFKSMFSDKTPKCSNDLCNVSLKVWEAQKLVKTSKLRNKNADSADVLRCLKLVKHNADMMRYTDNPDTFISNYTAAVENINKACGFKYMDKPMRNIICEISDMIYNMPKSCGECNGGGLTFYSVTFAGKRKEYYYLSGGNTYEIGQYVIAPAGDYMEPAVVKIVGIEHYTPTNAPMPPEFLKTITSPAIK
ncbi:MAG: hypothetical protein IJN62_03900 [Clostridia bacterium]|nr:hypothetical protein [Clostridia bacterium]